MTASAPPPPGRTIPSSGTLAESQVRAMFDRIAGVYDRMNAIMTAGLHHQWRRRAADLAALAPGGRALDVATGTGDLAFELARRVAPDGTVVGADFSPRMLELARAKAHQAAGASHVWPQPGFHGASDSGPRGEVELRFETANALDLPYEDDEFDAATVGFGARNFSDLRAGLSEMARVVRPGGRVVVLEITTPTRPPLSTLLEIWFDHLIPVLGRLAGDPDAYTYLPNSVRRFPRPQQLAGVMWECGLRQVRYLLTAGGIISLHVGEVPAVSAAGEVPTVSAAGEVPRSAAGEVPRSAAGEVSR